MAVIAVGGQKGGVGKTTLAVNLAIMRATDERDVLLVDADEQGTASDFTRIRDQMREDLGSPMKEHFPPYTAVQLRDMAVRDSVLRLKKKYDDIIIDVGGRDTASQRAALAVADKLIVPFLPRSFDLWTLDRVRAIVELMRGVNPKLKTLMVLNRADARGSDNEDAKELLTEEKLKGFELVPGMIVSRKAFPNAAAVGKGVAEYRPPDEKAIEEMRVLYHYVFSGKDI